MDDGYYATQSVRQQGPTRPHHNLLQPHYIQVPRPVAARERYRATQYDHPMYDAVEDDEYGQNAQLDSFDERMLQEPYNDRQHQAAQGRARLSLAPPSFRLYDAEVTENEQLPPRSQFKYQETYGDGDQQVYPGNAVRGSLNRFAHKVDQPLEFSSDVPLGASSSPAFNAGRRRAGQYEFSAFQQPSQLQSLEDIPAQVLADHRDDARYQHEANECPPRRHIDRPFQQVMEAKPSPNTISPSNMPPIVQGIPLVPVSALPDRLRTVFPFRTFNAVQSKCFDQIFKSDNNFVLSSPTGSGKTAILELAICRAVASNSTGQYKVVYQAPTKALCSERQRDWGRKFTQIDLKCAELTGDSDASDLRNVQSANIIVTTPEKWDSISRKWKDHEKLMRLIKLFLIDEVHILNDNRGAVLEAVVSRMKSIGTNVRFVALSATVPNLQDVAAWLGKSSLEPYVPAPSAKFGEEFRPVKLRKHVCGYVCNSNDFAFEKQLDAKLPEIINKYSERKPMMIFCATRNSCLATAQLVANWWGSRNGRDRLWSPPSQALHMQEKELRNLVASGVAFHHAGLHHDDRVKVEQAFLQGDISVICCTSTLAVGVNLPCHLVIIKNTIAWTQEGLQEYSDLEMMQMLGRAGRPQFDDSAVAVIMTRQTKARRYETLVTGEQVLESKLHLNLIDHVNAEIGLGTIRHLQSARKWLSGTFLYVRLQSNPAYYKLEGSRNGQDVQEQVDDICFRDIALLREHNLAAGEEQFRCTEFGRAMSRYYVQFETMKVFMDLQPKSTLSEILSAMAQAAEFSKIRFRQGEKSLYKTLNKSPSVRFPIPVNLDLPAQKVSLIIQSILGHADIPWEGDWSKHKAQYQQEVGMIFRSINGLVKCVIDCQICLGDSASIHSALMLERSLGSRAWDDSPLQMIQIPNIGAVSVRKLVNAGIRSMEDLESTDARRIETIACRNPPFGLKILDVLRSFPKLRVSLHIQPSSVTKTPEGVRIQVKADIGFINEKPPDKFGDKLIYVCMLAETSDGRKIHFTRINGYKLGAGQSLVFPALLTNPEQKINCYLMCEGIAGSMRDATVAPKIAPSMFSGPTLKVVEPTPTHKPNVSRRRIEHALIQWKKSVASDDFGDADIDDDALVKATCGDLDFNHIDNFEDPSGVVSHNNTTKNKPAKEKGRSKASITNNDDDDEPTAVRLPNGRWSCNHRCKDKGACKHDCCKHGMDRPPKKAASKRVPTDEHQVLLPPKSFTQQNNKTQTKLQLQASKRNSSVAIEELDLTQEKKSKVKASISGPQVYRDLHNVHKNIQKKDIPTSLHSVMKKKPGYCYGEGGQHQLSFLSQPAATRPKTSSEYGDLRLEDFPPESSVFPCEPTCSNELTSFHFSGKASVASRGSETFGDDDSTFGEAIVGLADSQDLRVIAMGTSSMQNHEARDAIGVAEDDADVDYHVNVDIAANEDLSSDLPKQVARTMGQHELHALPAKTRAPFFEATSSPEQFRHFKPAKSMLYDREPRKLQQRKAASPQPSHTTKDGTEDDDVCSDSLNMLDMPLADDQENIASVIAPAMVESPVQSVEPEKDEPKQISKRFKDLQPWLFQEFGDIVELVDD